MTVSQLKEQLIGVPDDALVVRPASDHCYWESNVELTNAIRYVKGKRYLCEDYGDSHNEPGGKRIAVLLFT